MEDLGLQLEQLFNALRGWSQRQPFARWIDLRLILWIGIAGLSLFVLSRSRRARIANRIKSIRTIADGLGLVFLRELTTSEQAILKSINVQAIDGLRLVDRSPQGSLPRQDPENLEPFMKKRYQHLLTSWGMRGHFQNREILITSSTSISKAESDLIVIYIDANPLIPDFQVEPKSMLLQPEILSDLQTSTPRPIDDDGGLRFEFQRRYELMGVTEEELPGALGPGLARFLLGRKSRWLLWSRNGRLAVRIIGWNRKSGQRPIGSYRALLEEIDMLLESANQNNKLDESSISSTAPKQSIRSPRSALERIRAARKSDDAELGVES